MMVTDPGASSTTGSPDRSRKRSPSLATISKAPSGLKASWSGRAPTAMDLTNAPVRPSYSATTPFSPPSAFWTATATTPRRTATEFTPP